MEEKDNKIEYSDEVDNLISTELNNEIKDITEDNKIERSLMSKEEFEKYIIYNRVLKTFEAISKFKSVKRAIRRGHVSEIGMIYPKRPFNNRTSKYDSRENNDFKKRIYARIRQHQTRM